MPARGKPINFKNIKPRKIGYLGSTTHRGTVLLTEKQKRLAMVKKFPHTNVYRSKNRKIYRKRVFPVHGKEVSTIAKKRKKKGKRKKK